MAGVEAFRVVLAVFSMDRRSLDVKQVYGTAWLVRSGVVVTCGHCIPNELPSNQALMVGRKGATGYDVRELLDVQRDTRGHDLVTARADFDADGQEWPLYPGVAEPGMQVWSFGYPLPRPHEEMGKFVIMPRFIQGYVTRRFQGEYPPVFPQAELGMPCPPGLSGAPLVYGGSDQVIGIVFGRTSVQVPDDVAIYTFGLAFDREILAGLTGPATDGLPLSEFMTRGRGCA